MNDNEIVFAHQNNIKPNEVVFTISDPKFKPDADSTCIQIPPVIELLKISPDGFYYMGERVDDIHNVYERFNEWLKLAEKTSDYEPTDATNT